MTNYSDEELDEMLREAGGPSADDLLELVRSNPTEARRRIDKSNLRATLHQGAQQERQTTVEAAANRRALGLEILVNERGLDKLAAYEALEANPGLLDELRRDIDRLGITKENEARANDRREREARPAGQEAINAAALRDKQERDRKVQAARARLERDYETLGAPPDAHQSLSDDEALFVTGIEPLPDDGSNDPETNRRIAEEGQ